VSTVRTTAGDAVIDGWSRDWAASLPRRSAEEYAQLAAAASRAVAELQAAAAGRGARGRALHARGIFATARAHLDIDARIPTALCLGPLAPGARWPATVRLSSAFPRRQSDEAGDQRGLAIRISDAGRRLDLLATTGAAHHARDAEAMIASLRAGATAARGGVAGRLGVLFRLVRDLGPRDGLRMARTASRARQAGISLAGLTFYSRAPFQLGDWAVRYRFAAEPAAVAGTAAALRADGPDALLLDLNARLREASVRWSFELQGFLDPVRTPMDDHRVPWDSPWISVGLLTLDPTLDGTGTAGSAEAGTAATGAGRAAAGAGGAAAGAHHVVSDADATAGFRIEPDWPDEAGAVFTPLGDLNRLRAAAYAVSAAGRN
jgi:hypothetical protein